jgi:succinate dehydrogenase/fumarate reductase-like Fe-S protein
MPFENVINLQIKAFFFNATTDYLPYYKYFDITVEQEANTLEILDKIKSANPNFSFPNRNIILKVNGLVTTAETPVSTLVENFGKELTIEPATTYRSNNGLILNDDDFMESFELLAPYATEEDKSYYESLYSVHYASETSNYNRQYIGDAVLLLASKMIAEGNENREAILEAISDDFNGIRCCEYENNILNGEDHTQTIATLKQMCTLKDTSSFWDKCIFKKRKHVIDAEGLANSNVALYTGCAKEIEGFKKLIEENAKAYIPFSKSSKLAGQTIMDTHFELAHKKAGAMLLDALDAGAEILVCTGRDVNVFQEALPTCERLMGRDINLKIISMHQLKELTQEIA